jgi:hypothetical protein
VTGIIQTQYQLRSTFLALNRENRGETKSAHRHRQDAVQPPRMRGTPFPLHQGAPTIVGAFGSLRLMIGEKAGRQEHMKSAAQFYLHGHLATYSAVHGGQILVCIDYLNQFYYGHSVS